MFENLEEQAWALYRTMNSREREVADKMRDDLKVKEVSPKSFRDRDRAGSRVYKDAGVDKSPSIRILENRKF